MSSSRVNNVINEDYKLFNDAVHGSMSLHPLCVKIIDTPQFQRLRFLKQLGNTYYVYPSASHTRFEHSIGVCHLAGRFVRELKIRLDDDLEHKQGKFNDDCRITAEDVLCIEIAGLCHDIGHGPMSHMWEAFMKKTRPENEEGHEDISLKMFDHLIQKNRLKKHFENYGLKDKDIEFIKSLIKGEQLKESVSLRRCGRGKEKAFLYEIVSNNRNGIDVDKCDYLLRDSHNLGIKVMFDVNRLEKLCRVVHVEGEGNIICIRDKEDDNLYSMLNCRQFLHRHAYQHRVVIAVDLMVTDVLCKANKHMEIKGQNGRNLPLDQCYDDMDAFTSLTDDILQRINHSEVDNTEMQEAKKIISDIMYRKFYKCIGEIPSDSCDIRTIHEEMKKHLQGKIKSEEICITKMDLHFGMKEKNPVENVYFYNKYRPREAKKIDFDPTYRILPSNFQEVRYRVFCRKGDKNSLKESLSALKKTCKSLNLPSPNEPNDDQIY